jgi:hypothetical protein
LILASRRSWRKFRLKCEVCRQSRLAVLLMDRLGMGGTFMRHSIQSRSATAAAIGATALLLVGCGSPDLGDTRAQAMGSAAVPTAVSCEPNQRALVHPAVINGTTVSQVECVSGQYATGPAATPVAYQPGVAAAMPVSYAAPAQQQFVPLENTRVVPVQQYPAAAPAPRRAVYQREPERVVRSTRSVKKSAIIIGSSAAGGAGLGALMGGKKGAAIGAIVGGGGATLWDQITRNKNK